MLCSNLLAMCELVLRLGALRTTFGSLTETDSYLKGMAPTEAATHG